MVIPSSEVKMKYTIIGFALLGVWILLAFVAALQTGWAHVPLAIGVIFIAMGIVSSKR